MMIQKGKEKDTQLGNRFLYNSFQHAIQPLVPGWLHPNGKNITPLKDSNPMLSVDFHEHNSGKSVMMPSGHLANE